MTLRRRRASIAFSSSPSAMAIASLETPDSRGRSVTRTPSSSSTRMTLSITASDSLTSRS
jgi:hypothetical protein